MGILARLRIRRFSDLPRWFDKVSIPWSVIVRHQPSESSSIPAQCSSSSRPSSVIRSHCDRSSFLMFTRLPIAARLRSVRQRQPSRESASRETRCETLVIASSVSRRQLASDSVWSWWERASATSPLPWMEWQLSSLAISRLDKSESWSRPLSVRRWDPRRSSSVILDVMQTPKLCAWGSSVYEYSPP
ncbi:unnamed protein product [Pseudo-nitzschia multistriata]|uniref:Uncharacterized protein n=1 Tax=Pseudo-nitzschia multistriata TaxID=183589 RepID=A0A448ZCK2_9STRA|nr:unnamed protein product [Pseudo-nitzschia multistriata]